MRLYQLAILSVVFLLFSSCGAKQLLQQANKDYLQAFHVAEQLQPQLYALNQQKNGLNIQGRALNPDEARFIDEVESLEDRYQAWKRDEIKAGDAGSELGPRRMSAHQKAWLAEILSIQEKVNALAGRIR